MHCNQGVISYRASAAGIMKTTAMVDKNPFPYKNIVAGEIAFGAYGIRIHLHSIHFIQPTS